MTHRHLMLFLRLSIVLFAMILLSCKRIMTTEKRTVTFAENNSINLKKNGATMPEKLIKSDDEWKQILTPEQYKIIRQKGTEPPFTGKYYNFTGEGIFQCVGCKNDLFRSERKFDSGTGWPSFSAPISEQSINASTDTSYGMARTEVACSRCDAHLGHVFHDGPPPTRLRYCINSAALRFVKKQSE